jgi:hypothetical protein
MLIVSVAGRKWQKIRAPDKASLKRQKTGSDAISFSGSDSLLLHIFRKFSGRGA